METFCEEPIKKVSERRVYGDEEKSWHNYHLQLVYSLELHTTYGYWIVFETENHVISVGVEGVVLFDSLEEAVPDSGELDEVVHDDFVQTEYTLFAGERIHAVEWCGSGWKIRFDHFTMGLYPYDESNSERISHIDDWNSYEALAAGGHKLTRTCDCGGEGEILMDFVGDYLVRCKSCHKSTWAEMCLIDAIDSWNRGEPPIELDTDAEMFAALAAKEPIRYIDVAKRGFWYVDDNLCDADDVMVVFADCAYRISCVRTGEDQYDFAFSCCGDYNAEFYGERITAWEAEEIRCLGFETDEDGRGLRFAVDDAWLLVTPRDMSLMVGFTCWDTEGEFQEHKRKALFRPEGF